ALFKTKDQHNHDEIANSGHGINKETEEYIEDLLEKGVQLPLRYFNDRLMKKLFYRHIFITYRAVYFKKYKKAEN
ncbi:hypothetical protein BpHYR1_001029, partial [Brachionus plicatilis]